MKSLSDAANLGRRRRPPVPNPRLLDLWTGGRRHAHACRASAPARVVAWAHAPHSRLVRLLDRVPSSAGGATAGGSWSRSGSRTRWRIRCGGSRRPTRADDIAGSSRRAVFDIKTIDALWTSMARRHAQGGTGCASAQSPRPAARASASAAASVQSREYRRNHTRSRPGRARGSGSARPAAARPRWSAHSGPGPARRPPRNARTSARR
jgi:hypothetical protein